MSLAHPAWLILLALLPVIGGLAVFRAQDRGRKWSTFVAARLRRSLIRTGSSLPRWIAFAFLLAAIAAITGALSRPQGDTGTRTETSVGRNLLIALDLSRSMRASDVKPDRLTSAKLVVYELLDALPNERIGLIGFAGNPHLYAPLTIDHRAVRETVEQIDETWPTLGGSNLGAAVELGIDTLKKTGQHRNALVIISDGEKHSGDIEEMISNAKASGVYILAIGVGTEDGDYVPHPDFPNDHMVSRDGTPVISRLQADTLRQLASETNGAYAAAGSGADLPAMISSAIAGLDSYELEGRDRKVRVEFYQWLTLPAIVFLIASLIAGTHWRGIQSNTTKLSATAILLLLLSLQPARGETSTNPPIETSRPQLSLPESLRFIGLTPNGKARHQLENALAAYQQQEFKQARSAYSRALFSDDPALRATAHHGLGNTLFQLGWQLLSDQPYPPQSPPNLTQFDALVRQYLGNMLGNASAESTQNHANLRKIITNWSDAVRHYDSALATKPDNQGPAHNRTLTLVYLKRLAQLLEEHENQANQMMPPPPQPKPDEGDQGDQGNDPKDSQKPDEGKNGPPKPDGSESPQDPQQQPNEGEPNGDQESGNKHNDPQAEPKSLPGETPEDRARRILKENADIEKGPLTPGYREFRDPEKDW